jgi:hypothetical protein
VSGVEARGQRDRDPDRAMFSFSPGGLTARAGCGGSFRLLGCALPGKLLIAQIKLTSWMSMRCYRLFHKIINM